MLTINNYTKYRVKSNQFQTANTRISTEIIIFFHDKFTKLEMIHIVVVCMEMIRVAQIKRKLINENEREMHFLCVCKESTHL